MIRKSMATIIAICAMFTASLAFAQSGGGKSGEAAKPKPFIFQDNSVRWENSSWYRAPFIMINCSYAATYSCPAANTLKNILGFTHVDAGNHWGDNLIDVYYTDNDLANPISTTHFHSNTRSGTKAFWATIRHQLVLDRVFNKDHGVGPIKNWFIVMGTDLGSKGDDFGSQIRRPQIGPGVNLKVPHGGYWNFSAAWTREWNQEGTDVTSYYYEAKAGPNAGIISNQGSICTVPHACAPIPATWGEPVVYSPREFNFSTNWAYPFTLGKSRFLFTGFSTLFTAKGYGAPQLIAFTGANAPSWGPSSTPVWYKAGTRPEWLTHARIMYNFGRQLFGEGHNYLLGAGYEYWHNEYGVGQRSPLPNNLFGTTGQVGGAGGTSECTSCIENAPFVSVEIHL